MNDDLSCLIKCYLLWTNGLTDNAISRVAFATYKNIVTFSHPRSLWEFAWLFLTVRQALSRRTPWAAHPARWPCPGREKPGMSRSSSLNMFPRLGGGGTPGLTEKQRPWAWPGPWYGSWPRITTLTSEMETCWVHDQTSPWLGKMVPLSLSLLTNSLSFWNQSLVKTLSLSAWYQEDPMSGDKMVNVLDNFNNSARALLSLHLDFCSGLKTSFFVFSISSLSSMWSDFLFTPLFYKIMSFIKLLWKNMQKNHKSIYFLNDKIPHIPEGFCWTEENYFHHFLL